MGFAIKPHARSEIRLLARRLGQALILTAFATILFGLDATFVRTILQGKATDMMGTRNVDSSLQEMFSSLDARKRVWQEYLKLSEERPKRKRLPDVVGIGVEKCGTEAVIFFLGHHPFVKIPKNIELNFFNQREKYQKGLDHYREMMPEVADHELAMEKSPSYFDSPPADIPEKIARDLPKAKIILVLCDPVKRSFSDYTHDKVLFKIWGSGVDPRKYPTFDSYLDSYLKQVKGLTPKDSKNIIDQHMLLFSKDRGLNVLTKGFYSVYLTRWLELFDSNRLLILNGDDFIKDPGAQVERMQEFLGIPKLLQASDFVRTPDTGLFCVRPWWTDYNFEDELNGAPEWHKQLSCLKKGDGIHAKGRTRHANGTVMATEKHMESLRNIYRPFNTELYAMTGINFEK